MKEKPKIEDLLFEIFMAVLAGIFTGIAWSNGDEGFVVFFITAVIFLWKAEWNRSIK